MKESLAILWDVENVTPSAKNIFVNGLMDYASEQGKVAVAIAYSDWTRSGMKGIAEVLSEHSFELTHVPHNNHKNSSDITLITRAIELIHQYPHLKKMILVTGDADFRPLLQSMRKYGVETIIICDAKSASEDLLLLADSYRDFRDIIASQTEESGDNGNEDKDGRENLGMSFIDAVALVKEAVQVLASKKKPTTLGAVKVRMRLLNENFSEKELRQEERGSKGNKGESKVLRFKSWKDFVLSAVKSDPELNLVYTEKDTLITLKNAANSGLTENPSKTSRSASGKAQVQTIQIPEIIRQFLLAVRNVQKTNSHSGDTNPFVAYSTVSQYLIDISVDIRQQGYKRIRTLVEAAEKRDLVETHSEDQHWSVRLTEEGLKYC